MLTSVYLYFDHRGILIYVGITARGKARQIEHNQAAEWWRYVAKQEIEHYESREEAAVRESWLIRNRRPPFNNAGNCEYRQLRAAYLFLFDPVALPPTFWPNVQDPSPAPNVPTKVTNGPSVSPRDRALAQESLITLEIPDRRRWVADRMKPGDELSAGKTQGEIDSMGAELFGCSTKTIRRDRDSIRPARKARP